MSIPTEQLAEPVQGVGLVGIDYESDEACVESRQVQSRAQAESRMSFLMS